MQYDFFAPARILFGWGRRRELGPLAAGLGRRAFVVVGSQTLEQNGTLGELLAQLDTESISHEIVARVRHEPEVADVDQAVAQVRAADPSDQDLVIGIGGGSAVDLAKAVAALATNRAGETVTDYLEGVGRGLRIEQPPLSILAVPTTAGTGSEATKNAVISSYDPPFKKSLRSERMVPRAVLVDPELHKSVPPRTTAYTGMDAITQLIESYVSARAQPIPQALCLGGLRLAVPSIVEAVRNGSSKAARENMAHAALLSGMALANSGLGMAHGVAAALGVHCRVPHGLACAVMLPASMVVNLPTCTAQFAELAEVLTGRTWPNPNTAAEASVEAVIDLCRQIEIPERLSPLGVTAEQLPALVQGSRGNSMSGNPRELSDDELGDILEQML